MWLAETVQSSAVFGRKTSAQQKTIEVCIRKLLECAVGKLIQWAVGQLVLCAVYANG